MLRVDEIHWRTVHLVYNDYNSTYEELLASHNDISIHQKYLKYFAIEVYKSLTNLNPELMQSLFKNKSIPYNLRNGNICILPPARSSHYGINSVQLPGSLLWNNLPKQLKNLFMLKNSNRNWIMQKRFTVLVLHVEDFKLFVCHVSISFCLVGFYQSCNYCLTNIKVVNKINKISKLIQCV